MYNQNDLHKLSAHFQAFGFGFFPGLAFGSNPVSDIHRKNLENLNQETVQLGNRKITSVDFTDNAVPLAALGRHFQRSPGGGVEGGGSQPAVENKPRTLKNLHLHHQACSGAAGCTHTKKNNPRKGGQKDWQTFQNVLAAAGSLSFVRASSHTLC